MSKVPVLMSNRHILQRRCWNSVVLRRCWNMKRRNSLLLEFGHVCGGKVSYWRTRLNRACQEHDVVSNVVACQEHDVVSNVIAYDKQIEQHALSFVEMRERAWRPARSLNNDEVWKEVIPICYDLWNAHVWLQVLTRQQLKASMTAEDSINTRRSVKCDFH